MIYQLSKVQKMIKNTPKTRVKFVVHCAISSKFFYLLVHKAVLGPAYSERQRQ